MKDFLKNINWSKIIKALIIAFLGAIGNETSSTIQSVTEPIAQTIVSSINLC